MRTAVVCYSRHGSTARVARAVAERLGAELRTVESVKQYGFLGMGFRAAFNIRVPLKPMELDFSGFEWVVLCTPVWVDKPACPARTFLREAKLAGRKLAVVLTCGGGGIERAVRILKQDTAGRNIELMLTERVVTDKATSAELEEAGRRFAARLNATA